MPNKLEKYLTKQYKGDKKGVMLIRLFIDELEKAADPTTLKKCRENARSLERLRKFLQMESRRLQNFGRCQI